MIGNILVLKDFNVKFRKGFSIKLYKNIVGGVMEKFKGWI